MFKISTIDRLSRKTMPLGGTVRVSPLGIMVLVGCGLLLFYLNLPGVHVSNNPSAGPEKMVSMKHLLAVTIEVAKRGGVEVKAVRESVSPFIVDVMLSLLILPYVDRLILVRSPRARPKREPTTL